MVFVHWRGVSYFFFVYHRNDRQFGFRPLAGRKLFPVELDALYSRGKFSSPGGA